jgi:uncharacterized membrane protein YcjF (UPF0283 family)
MAPAEVPLENAQEEILHHAEHSRENWITGVALAAALLAVLAAVTALLAEHGANEALLLQIRSSDQWAFYQAKGIKANVLEMRIELLTALEKPVSPSDREKLADYHREQKEIFAEAESLQRESQMKFAQHRRYSYGVTMFQVGIAISAIAALTRRRTYWHVAMVFGVIGLVLLGYGLVA